MIYRPLDIACAQQNKDGSNCGAAAGESCNFWGFTGPVTLDGSYHARRIEDAAAASTGEGGAAPGKEEFTQAVLDTGLV